MPEKDEIATVPFFIHEAVCDKMEKSAQMIAETSEEALKSMDKSNRRMLAALISVCVNIIFTVCSFLFAYTKMNDKWFNFIENNYEEVHDETMLDEGNAKFDSGAFKG